VAALTREPAITQDQGMRKASNSVRRSPEMVSPSLVMRAGWTSKALSRRHCLEARRLALHQRTWSAPT